MYCIAPVGALEKNKWPRATELWSLSGPVENERRPATELGSLPGSFAFCLMPDP